MIRFDNISKKYPDGTVALADVSVEIPAGQFCILLGHSGAGKSTLLRLVNGLTTPSSGTVSIGDTVLTPKTLNEIRLKVSMIYQEFNLSGRSTVATNVMAGALAEISTLRAMFGLFPKRIRRKCCELVELVGLEEKQLHRQASKLSGGQQQRVGIARSLMLDPHTILADEPIASLDPTTSQEILTLLKSAARERGATVMCSLHQVDLARKFADRIIGMDSGRVVFDLDPSQLNDDALELIYRNYDDTSRQSVIESATVDNVKANSLERA